MSDILTLKDASKTESDDDVTDISITDNSKSTQDENGDLNRYEKDTPLLKRSR